MLVSQNDTKPWSEVCISEKYSQQYVSVEMKLVCFPQTTPLEFYPDDGKVGRWMPSTLHYSSQIVSKRLQDLPPKWGTVVCGETPVCKNRSGRPLSSPSAAKAVAAEIKTPADDQFEKY